MVESLFEVFPVVTWVGTPPLGLCSPRCMIIYVNAIARRESTSSTLRTCPTWSAITSFASTLTVSLKRLKFTVIGRQSQAVCPLIPSVHDSYNPTMMLESIRRAARFVFWLDERECLPNQRCPCSPGGHFRCWV